MRNRDRCDVWLQHLPNHFLGQAIAIEPIATGDRPKYMAPSEIAALQDWDVYGDTTARTYLETAKKWLTEENRRSPWQRGVQRLLRLVDRKLDLK